MSQTNRWLVGTALGLPLLALLFFVLVPARPPTQKPPPSHAPASATEEHQNEHFPVERAPTKNSDASPAVSPPGGDPAAPASPAPEDFEQPDTQEEYWEHLEHLQRTDKPRALAYALQGEQWYPDTGKPAEARRAMIITLQVDLGQMDEARARTRDFIDRYPESPYRRLIQGATGIHPRPGAPPGHQR